jgi:cation transport regulator ChaC
MSVQPKHPSDRHDEVRRNSPQQLSNPCQLRENLHPLPLQEPMFYYFAYGSCMCPVDLKRSLGENTHPYVIGAATLKGYRLGFYSKSTLRKCGVLDVVVEPTAAVEGVLYQLPWRLSDALDLREEIPTNGYRHESVEIHCQGRIYKNVRTYVVVDKLAEELAPNDWYFNVVLRGAVTCGLPEPYCWKLFEHMHQLQQGRWRSPLLRSA